MAVSRGTQLAYTIAGKGTGPTLLFVHPLGASSAFWDEVACVLSTDFRVVAYDLRGAGLSPLPPRPWTLRDHVNDLVFLRRELDLGAVVPIGCAIGSLIAASFAAAEICAVEALVLSDTAPLLDEVSRERTAARVGQVRKTGMQSLLPEVIDLAFKGLPRDIRYERYFEIFERNDPEGYAAIAEGMMGSDIRLDLRRLSCPALVTVGENDILLPPELSKAVHEMIAGSEFEIIPGAAHFAPYQAPDYFAELVRRFLNRRIITN